MLQFMYIYFSLIVNSITTGTHFLFIIQQCSIDSAVDDTESVRVPLCHYCIHFRFLEREIIFISVHEKKDCCIVVRTLSAAESAFFIFFFLTM